MICNIQDPITREDYTRDPRNVARKAVNYLKSTGVADTCFIGPEAEFFIFDDVRFDQTPNCGFFYLDSDRRRVEPRRRDEKPEPGLQAAAQGRLLPRAAGRPALMDIRNEMMQTMIDCGIDVEAQHHEVATAGQSEIDLKFTDLVTMADKMCMYKYIIKNVAKKYGKTVTFMPKPLFRDNGSGMHTHISFWKGDKPLFAGNGYAGLSEMAPVRHRRHPEARPGDPGLRLPDDQQLQAAGARLRGAGEPGLLAAEPLGRLPHSDVQPEPEGQADRVPLPRPELQSVPGVRRADDGRARRHPEQDPSGRAAGQGHLRPGAGGAGQGAEDARLAGRVARRAGEGPRVPAPRRRVHRGRDQHLDLGTRRRTKWTRCACGRIRTSSACTTTCKIPRLPLPSGEGRSEGNASGGVHPRRFFAGQLLFLWKSKRRRLSPVDVGESVLAGQVADREDFARFLQHVRMFG